MKIKSFLGARAAESSHNTVVIALGRVMRPGS